MKYFLRNKGIWILLLAVALTVAGWGYAAVSGGMANPAANAVGIAAQPVQKLVTNMADWLERFYNYSFEYKTLEEENAQLRQQVAELQEQAREGQEATQENERLRELLGLAKKRTELTFESALVIARSATNWNSTLTLSKGTADGVKAGDCVVDETGVLVGVVSETGLNWSTVITVVDPDLEMGAKAVRTESVAVLQGDFTLMTQGRLKLNYLPEDAQLLSGDEIVTFSTEGVYPSGLVVGSVEELGTDESGMTSYAVIVPAAKLDNLSEVFVIKAFDQVD